MRKDYGIDLKWLAVSSYELRFNGFTVVTDPYITECVGTDLTWEAVENCDAICLSHSHWDHITDIPRLVNKFHPKVLCGDKTAELMAKWLNCSPTVVYPMYPDTELDFDSVKIRALYGRHTNLGQGYNDLCARLAENEHSRQDPGLAALQPMGSFDYRNYLFTLPNGTKLLIWGNDPTVEQLNLCKSLKPDIVIMQRSVKPEAAAKKAEFAAKLGCKILIPHHHDFRGVDDPEIIGTFKREFLARAPESEFISPVHGEWIHL